MPDLLKTKIKIIPLIVYWLTIFIITHIPVPDLVRQAQVSDKSIHIIAYLLLAFFLAFALNPLKKLSPLKPTFWAILLIASIYAFLDEWLQTYVGRNANFPDFLANIAGTILALIILSLLNFLPALLTITAIIIFMLKNLAKTNPADLVPIANALFHFFAFATLTFLWLLNLKKYLNPKISKITYVFIAILPPALFAFALSATAKILNHPTSITEIILSLAGVLAVLILFQLFKNHRPNRPWLFPKGRYSGSPTKTICQLLKGFDK